jgi:hypothetical protein
MRLRPSAVLCGALLAPMGVAVEIHSDSISTSTPSETPEGEKITRFTFGGGGGTYGRTIHTERTIFLGIDDCTGIPLNQNVDAEFRFKEEYNDYGGEVDFQVSPTFHLGVRGGWVNETAEFWGSTLDQAVIDTLFQDVQFRDSSFTYIYFNPFIAVEKRTAGFGLGFVYSGNRLWTDETREYEDHDDPVIYPTGHVRLGRLDQAYFKMSLWESVPIYSGGGMFVLGIGVRPAKPLDLFVGMANGGPYTSSDILLRANVDFGRHLVLGANVRLKSDVEESFSPRFSEKGSSLSLTYKLHH